MGDPRRDSTYIGPLTRAAQLKVLEAQVADARKKSRNKELMLDSFIISQTHYDDLRRRHGAEWTRAKYAEAHVLFDDEPNNGHIEAIGFDLYCQLLERSVEELRTGQELPDVETAINLKLDLKIPPDFINDELGNT